MITKDQVLKVQNEWGDGVVKIGELKIYVLIANLILMISSTVFTHLKQDQFYLNQLSVKKYNSDQPN